MYLTISVALNVALALALIVMYFRAQNVAREEKIATFAGCVRAITDGLANKEEDVRWELMAKGLSSLRGGLDADEIRWRMVRASFIRLFRTQPALMDVGGEHVCGLISQATNDPKAANEVWDYIDHAIAGDEGYGEPFARFEQKELAAAQLQFQGEIVQMYAKAIKPETIKVFG
jgi:hypothetical protein